jgi:hypothetical protein
MARRLSEQAAQRAASEIAKQYGLFECDRCAAEIAKKLTNRFPHVSFERLRTSDKSDVIGFVEEGVKVSRNRTHVGVRVGGRIFDNLHHHGVPADEWTDRFVALTEAPLDRDSKPVSEFFGKRFLTRKFLRWLFAW